jgi:hypothetical protein
VKKNAQRRPIEARKSATHARRWPAWIWPAAIALLILFFFWTPLTSPAASIQWDAADMHYPLQKAFSDGLHAGRLPFWTPYIFSGYPLLAYPETGAWYPLNWPFFLFGVTPRSIEMELALHALLACVGAWLLIRQFIGSRMAALFGAIAYGLSGFFAGHSSHVGIFCVAAGMPWLLLCFRRAMEGAALRYVGFGGLIGGAILLAGHFQTALYAFAALGLFALAEIGRAPRRWRRLLAMSAGMLLLALLISSVMVLPGLELTKYSIRAGADFSRSGQGALEWRTLATLVSPNALGAVSGQYTGPSDITQYYFYGGRCGTCSGPRRGFTVSSVCCPASGKCAPRSTAGSSWRSPWRSWPRPAWPGSSSAGGSPRLGRP